MCMTKHKTIIKDQIEKGYTHGISSFVTLQRYVAGKKFSRTEIGQLFKFVDPLDYSKNDRGKLIQWLWEKNEDGSSQKAK